MKPHVSAGTTLNQVINSKFIVQNSLHPNNHSRENSAVSAITN